MAHARLDARILEKLARKAGHNEKYMRERISKRAAKFGIASEAAQVLLAKELNIATSRYQRSLPPHVQEQIREHLPTSFVSQRRPSASVEDRTRAARGAAPLRLAIEYLLRDPELKARCSDLLRARGKFDRVFREATTVLDDRLKRLTGIIKMNPANLVAKALHQSAPILQVSIDQDEQEGFFSICKGLVLAFRNPAHHELTDKFTREDALKFCGFVDSLLGVLGQAQKVGSP